MLVLDTHMQALLCSGLMRRATADTGGHTGGTGLHRSSELRQRLLKVGAALGSEQLPCRRNWPWPLRSAAEEDQSGLMVISATGALMLKQLADFSPSSMRSRQFPTLLGRGLAVTWDRSAGRCSEDGRELEQLLLLVVEAGSTGRASSEEALQDRRSTEEKLKLPGLGSCEPPLSLVLQDARLSTDLKISGFEHRSDDSSRILSREQLLGRNRWPGTPVERVLDDAVRMLILDMNTSFMGESVSSKASFLIRLSKRHSVDRKRLAGFRWGALAGWGQFSSSWLFRFPRWAAGAVMKPHITGEDQTEQHEWQAARDTHERQEVIGESTQKD